MYEYSFRVQAGFFDGRSPIPAAVAECAAEHRATGRLAVLDCRAPGYPSVPLVIHDPVGTTMQTIGRVSAVMHQFTEHLICNFPDSAHLVFVNFRHVTAPPGSQPKAVDWSCGPQPCAEYQFFKLLQAITEGKRGECPFEWICLSEDHYDQEIRAAAQAECEAAMAVPL